MIAAFGIALYCILILQIVILVKFWHLGEQMSTTNTALAALQAQVTQNTSVEASAITLIQGLAAEITAAGTDPAALAGAHYEPEYFGYGLSCGYYSQHSRNPDTVESRDEGSASTYRRGAVPHDERLPPDAPKEEV